jgi:hypothetical protein
MEGDDEILFAGSYKEFNLGIRFPMKGKSKIDAAYALAYVSQQIEDVAFRFSGIDTKKIDAMAKVNGSGMNAVIKFLETQKPNELRASLMTACPKPELISVAECYFFNRVFENAGVAFKLKPALLSSSLKPETEKPSDQMILLAKYGNWISIKKLSIDKTTEPWEVAGILSGINNTIVNKAFELADATGSGVAFAGRKSMGNVAEALKKIVLTGTAINDALILNKTMEALGYKPYAHPDMLTAAYPDIKGVKLKGRKPKA